MPRSIFTVSFVIVALIYIQMGTFAATHLYAQTIKCDTVEEKARCEVEYQRLESERKAAEAAAAAEQAKSSSYERDIALLRAKIKASQLDIQAKTILIQTLGKDIVSKANLISELEGRIELGKRALADLMRRTSEIDDTTMAEVILSQATITSLFSEVDAFQSIQSALQERFSALREDQAQTTAEKEALTSRQNAEMDAKYEIEQQKKKIESDQKELQKLLNISEQNKKAYSALAAQKAAAAAQVLAALFPLAGSKAIPFGEALTYADAVYEKTGIQPAFLLALLKQETNIGANVGQCYLTNTSDGSGINSKTSAYVAKLMKPDRDVQPFLALTAKLGYDYRTTIVSCPQAVGYGGAMGPAQFIPSTWELFKDRVAAATGSVVANPWKPMDAFMASGMYLADLGGASTRAVSTTAQKNAACRYYSGRACGLVTGNTSYANNVLYMAYVGSASKPSIQTQIEMTRGYR